MVDKASAWNYQLWGSWGQRSRSHEAKDWFVGLADASLSTPLDRVAFLVFPILILIQSIQWAYQVMLWQSRYMIRTRISLLQLEAGPLPVQLWCHTTTAVNIMDDDCEQQFMTLKLCWQWCQTTDHSCCEHSTTIVTPQLLLVGFNHSPRTFDKKCHHRNHPK